MKFIKKIYPYITLVLFPAFFVHRLFLEKYLFYGEERGFLNYDFVNYRFNAIWESTKNFGGITTNHFNIFTTGLFWKITTFFKLSWFQSEALFYYTIIFFTVFFAFLTLRKISKNTPLSLLLSLIYITTFNYYATITTTPKLLQVLILPASLFFWLMFKETSKIRYFLINTIVLILCLGIGINPPQMIGAYSFVFLYILLFDFKSGHRIKAVFFYLPYILNVVAVFLLQLLVLKNSGQIHAFNVFDQNFSATNSSIYEILRFFGAWWDYDGSGGLMYNHMSDFYHSIVGVVITYIPFIMFTALAYVQRKSIALRNRLIIFAILLLFLAKGGGMPFGELFNFAYQHVSYLKIFREPWAKFIVNFIFAIYIGIAYFFAEVPEKIKKASYVLLGLLLLFQLLPLTLGNVIDHRNLSWKVSDVNVPEYWESASVWSKINTRNKRVLILPAKIDTVGTLVQNWKPFYYIGYPDEYFIYGDIINSQYNNKEDEYITSNFLKHLHPSLLSLASIDYVIDKNDLMVQKNEKLLGIETVAAGIEIGKRQQHGGLDIYPVKADYKTSRIRTVATVLPGPKDCSQFFSKYASKDFRSTAYTSDNIPKIGTLNASQPNVTRINSTEYLIDFGQTTNGSSALFFAEAFNTGWQLYDSPNLFAQPLKLDHLHYVGNCFGNLWILPQSLVDQNPTVYLRFTPQVLYEKAKLLYLAILTLITVTLAAILFTKKSHNAPAKTSQSFQLGQPKGIFTKFRLFFLFTPMLIIVYTFLTPRRNHDIPLLLAGILWGVAMYSYQLPARINAIIVSIFLITTILCRVISFNIMAEIMGIWTILFLFLIVLQSFLVRHEIVSENITKLYYHITSPLKIGIMIILAIPILFIYKGLELEQFKQYLIPTITSVQPEVAQKNKTVTINGTMFSYDKYERAIIRSTNGDIKPDSITQSSITFRVPVKWKSGLVEIWVGRPTLFEGQYILFESEKRIIEIE